MVGDAIVVVWVDVMWWMFSLVVRVMRSRLVRSYEESKLMLSVERVEVDG